MDTDEHKDYHSEPTTFIIVDGKHKIPGVHHGQDTGKSLIGLPIYLVDKDIGVIQALDVQTRNVLAHRSPALLKHAVVEALQALQHEAKKEGLYKCTDCVVHWKPSLIPFLVEFEVSTLDGTCQHLASIRLITARDPDQYARNLVTLAKLFLSKSPGSRLPHLPFTRPHVPSDNRSSLDAEDKRTTETIQHSRLIRSQYNDLKEIDIKTAEITAKMVNTGKIFSSLLVYLTSSKPRVEDTFRSKEPQKVENKVLQTPARPISATLAQPKSKSSAYEVQSVRPISKHNRVAPQTQTGTDGLTVTAVPPCQENCIPDDTSAMKTCLLHKPNTAISSLKERKASRKNKKGRKQAPNEATKIKEAFTVSAYPTQRPPRQKRARNTITARKPLEATRLRPEACDLEQVRATLLYTPETSDDDDDHKEYIPESRLPPEELSQKNSSSPESSSETYKGSELHTVEVAPDPELIAAEIGGFSRDIVQDEDLISTGDKPTALCLPTKHVPQHESGVHGLLWAYESNTETDKILEDAGIWLWRRPNKYFCAQPLLRTKRFGRSVQIPVVVSHERTGNDELIIEFDGKSVHIVPHEHSWEDVRSHESHPDFIVPWRLAEYQACEVAGYQVWRHDRDHLKCHKLGCNVKTSDYHQSVVVCLGCGPKSIVRYCSLQHQFEDIGRHWKECGTSNMLLKRVIDHTTAPSKFARMYPAIKQRYGFRTAALHRQRVFCALTSGHYTLFNPGSTYSNTLCWPKQDPKWPEMDRRIERLLNVAFFDSRNHYILGYLYRLLREMLRSRGEWTRFIERSLRLQFESEFSNYKVNTRWHGANAPCQCEWSGKIFPRWDHLSSCSAYDPAADDCHPVWRHNCIGATVEAYEGKFWILRTWQQQHPTQNNWRLRAAGYGFSALTPDKGCYRLGPGWTGWGGEKDNICEDQWEQGEKRSMWSA